MSLIRKKSSLAISLLGVCLAANVNAVELGKVGDTTVTLKGFIKLDAIYSDFDSGQLGAGSTARDFYLPALTPVGDGDGGTSLDMHARQSRVALQTNTDVGSSKVKTYVEFDFYGAGGTETATNLRGLGMRHAFFTYNKWLFGQTWTTFMDTSVLPETLDFIGNTDAMPFARQAQIRYTNGGFQFALENPETTVWGVNTANDDNEIPDIVAKYSLGSGGFNMSFAGIFRQLQTVDGSESSSTDGFGAGVSGSFKWSRADLKFLGTYGSGLGRYFGLTGNIPADVFINGDGELEAVDSLSYYIAFRFLWNDKWRSTLSYSAIDIDDTDAFDDAWTTGSNSFRVNLLTSPLPNLTFGGELALAQRDVHSGDSGRLTRFQFSAKLAF